MRLRYISKTFLAALAVSVLTACGGGGGGGDSLAPATPTTPTGGGDAGTTAPSLELTILDSTNANAFEVNGNAVLTLRVVARDNNGDVVNGLVVTFSSEVGALTPSSGRALTGADGNDPGVATLLLGAGSVAGAGEVVATATIDDAGVESNRIGVQTDGQGQNEGSVAFNIAGVTLDNSSISRASEGNAEVTVTDTAGGGQRALVQFSVTGGELEPSSGAVFSDALTGIATISVLPGVRAGAGVVSATVTLDNETLNATQATFISAGDGVATIGLDTASGTSVATIAGTVTEMIVATVRDRRNQPVEGAVVTFQLSGEGATLSRAQDITDENGIADTILVAESAVGVGDISATTSVAGVNVASAPSEAVAFQSSGNGLFEGRGSSNLSIELVLSTDADLSTIERNLDALNPGVLVATVRDPSGALVSDVVVRFTTEFGDLFPQNGLTLTVDGVATANVGAGSVPGAGTATAAIVFDGQTFDSDTLTFETLGNAGDTDINIQLNFADATPGNNSNTITESQGATVTVLVQDGGGNQLPNRSAIIATTLGNITVRGITGSPVLTDSGDDGRIVVSLAAGGQTGSGDLVVTVGDTTQTIQFEAGVDGLRIGVCNAVGSPTVCDPGEAFSAGALAVAPDTSLPDLAISANGTATVSVVATDQSGNLQEGIEISFTTRCAVELFPETGLPQATITGLSETDSQGVATANYQAQRGCVGADNITATEATTGQTAIGSVTVRDPVIGSIKFDSVVVDPSRPGLQSIQIRETGGITTARVIFQVLDKFNDPAAGRPVSLQLTSNVGGLELQGQDDSGVAIGVTDEDGFATAFVQAGFVPTTIRVRGSIEVDTDEDGIDDTTLVTLSGVLTVNTGVADQNSMTIAATRLNVEGEDAVGDESIVTVRMGDAFNNPVPDGTPVSFTTELGVIEGACTTSDGACSVRFTAQNPRRPNDPNDEFKFRTIDEGQCPTHHVAEETVTIAGTDGDTEYVLAVLLRVETAGDVALSSTTDYELDADGTGITCRAGSASCTDGATVKVSYLRRYLDEDDSDDNTHLRSRPGVATLPYNQRSNVPCPAPFRARGIADSGYHGGLGQPHGGRSTILAYSQGEESFVDSNGNGLYDLNEPFVDLPEAFLDKNEDGVFGNTRRAGESRDPDGVRTCYGPSSPNTVPDESLADCVQVGGLEESFIDYGPPEIGPNDTFDAGNRIYNGTLCPKVVSESADLCDNTFSAPLTAPVDPCDDDGDTLDPNGDGLPERFCTRALVNISRDISILLAGSTSFGAARDTLNGEYVVAVDISPTGPGASMYRTQFLDVTANDGTTIAAGTAFSIGIGDTQAPYGTGETRSLVYGGSSVLVELSDKFGGVLPVETAISVTLSSDSCKVDTTGPGVQRNTSAFGYTQIVATMSPDPAKGAGSGTVTFSTSTPRGFEANPVAFSCTF